MLSFPVGPLRNRYTDNNCASDCLALDEDYILQFAPPFNRLELLQAQSCPAEITNHVEQL